MEVQRPTRLRTAGGHYAGCSKSSFSKAAGELKPEAYPRGYVEHFDEPRTKHGEKRVSARRGWAGEKGGFFSILLGREELFGVGRCKPTEPSSLAGAVQNRHFQALQ